jgi:phytoene dehydrogenase-like protein
MGVVVGGSKNMPRALVRCIESFGGTVKTAAEVVKINVSGGKATGVSLKSGEVFYARNAVVANIHPWDLGEMIDGIDPDLVRKARNVQLSDYGAINQQYALTEAPIWKAGAKYKCSIMNECIQRDMTSLRRGFDAYRYGEMPLKHLSPLISIQSDFDPSRAPAGKSTMYLYHFAPMILNKGGLEGWDAIKEDTADAIFEEFCSYTTNMDKSKVIARHVESPLDHHRHSRSMKNGDFFGCGSFTSQLLGRRPIPELAQYRVPGLDGFYLTGPFMHPGGTVTLGGRATAMRMLMDWKIDLETAFTSF